MDKPFNAGIADVPEQAAAAAARLVEEVGDKAAQAKDAVTDFGRRTVEQLDAQRKPASRTLNRTASALHQQADKAAGAAHAAADRLETTAEYLRGHDVKAMSKDALGLVRRHPGPALVAAAVVGFLAARAIRPRE